MKRHMRWSMLGMLLVVVVALALVRCSSPGPTPTPTKTARPSAADTSVPPTATPMPPITVETATPMPTDTATPETPADTATPVSEPTQANPNPGPVVTMPPLPAVPDGVWPLTGLPVSDPALLERPPFAVKISNNPEVRPQSGLQEADVVFEHLAEGGFTRYTAIFHSTGADRVGAVRSARLIDLEIPAMYKSAFAYSGASNDVTQMLYTSDFSDRVLSQGRGDPGFYRIPIPGLATEHTLFTDTNLLWSIAKDRGWYGLRDLRGMRFDPSPPGGGQAVASVFIPYSSAYSNVTWTWDPARGAYLHSVLGEPHKDALTGQQIGASNVVLVYVNHVTTLIVEDRLGAKSIQIQLWGQGQATVLRDGQAWDVTWMRPNRPDPLVLVGADGQLFPLKPGNTWYDLVPLTMKVTVK